MISQKWVCWCLLIWHSGNWIYPTTMASAIDRRLSVTTEFIKELGTDDFSATDIERINTIMPFLTISMEADTMLETLASAVNHELKMNVAQYYKTILSNADEYCRYSLKREALLHELSVTLGMSSQPVGRALMGMIRAARVFDRHLLESMFRPTPEAIVDGSRRPAEALILKCSFTHHKFPFLSQRLVTLKLSPSKTDMDFLTLHPMHIKNMAHNWFAHVQQASLHFTSSPLTQFALGKHDNKPGGAWMIRGSESSDNYLYVTPNNTVENLGPTRSKTHIGRFRLFPTEQGSYFIDTEFNPCAFMTISDVNNSWDATVTLNAHYPPTKSALWKFEHPT